MRRADGAPESRGGVEPPDRRRGPALRRMGARLQLPLTLLGGALLGVLIMLIYLQLRPPPGQFSLEDVRRIAQEQIASITPSPPVEPAVYAQVRPSVVLITVAGRTADNTSFSGRGSGVVVDENGAILTSLHVIAGADTVEVRFFDGTTRSARVVARQPERDLALLQVDGLPQGVEPATLGGSVSPGDPVLAIGAPFGLEGSVTKGVVSGLGRRFTVAATGQTLENMIQFDAAVNPGNSGGPLVDRQGHVVGIVAGIANPTNQNVFIGLGFAVPIEAAAGLQAPIH